MQKLKAKLLIFDFDGTLADTKKRWYSTIFRTLKQEKIFCPECEARLIIHFGKKILDILKELEIEGKRAKKISEKIHHSFFKTPGKIKLCPGFSNIKKIHLKKVIISNSPTFAIKKILKNKTKIFSGIYGGDKFKDKPSLIKKIMGKYKIERKNVFYVGDRAGDVRVARESGCRSIIVSNKHSWNSGEEILREKPDFVINNLDKIRDLINSSSSF